MYSIDRNTDVRHALHIVGVTLAFIALELVFRYAIPHSSRPISLVFRPIVILLFLIILTNISMNRMRAFGYIRIAGLIPPLLIACDPYFLSGALIIPEAFRPIRSLWNVAYPLGDGWGDPPIGISAAFGVVLLFSCMIVPAIGASSARSRIPGELAIAIPVSVGGILVPVTFITYLRLFFPQPYSSINEANGRTPVEGNFITLPFPLEPMVSSSVILFIASIVTLVSTAIIIAYLGLKRRHKAFREPERKEHRDFDIWMAQLAVLPWQKLVQIAFLVACGIFYLALLRSNSWPMESVLYLLVIMVPAILPTTLLYLGPLATAHVLARRRTMGAAFMLLLALAPFVHWWFSKLDLGLLEPAWGLNLQMKRCEQEPPELGDLPGLTPSGWMLKNYSSVCDTW